MPKFQKHIFVCCAARPVGHPRGCCGSRSGDAVREAFKAEIERRGLEGKVRANLAGCLGQCEHGVTVVVYPEAAWYGFVKIEDVPAIMDQHVIGGRPVARLLLPEACLNTPDCLHRPQGASTD